MALEKLTIENILEGWSTTDYFSSKGQYNSSLGVDPDLPATSSATKTSGVLVPTRYEKFSGTEIDGYPNWIITNNKTSDSYVYTSTGKVHSFNSSITMRATDAATSPASFPITITGGAGNGSWYYNNFVYFAEATDISQYGPLITAGGLTTSVVKTENVWTGAKFGKTALSNATYPSIQGVPIPNHPGHVHTDGSAYIGDTLAGQGIIHRMNTKKGTDEGDTNGTTVVSAYNALDLPFGYYPTDIESYGTDLVISAIQTTDSTINQGKAALFFWDPTNTDSFYRQIALPDPLVTALLNVNGVLHIWSGNASNGVRVSRYIGGETVSEISYSEEGTPPFAGAVDALGSRLVWGISTTYPETSASVVAFGSKNDALPKGIHNIIRTTSSGSTPTVTSLKYVQQASNIQPRLIVGWGDGTSKGLDKLSTTATFNSLWRSKIFNINKTFLLKRLLIPLANAVDSNTTITVKIYLDDLSSSVTLNTINNTNYPNKRKVYYKPSDLSQATGNNNFLIEIKWTGTTSMPVLVPIILEVDISEDEL